VQEIELKLCYDPGEERKIIDFCAAQGFVYQGCEEQEDLYFSPCHKNLFALDQALRVRRSLTEAAGGGPSPPQGSAEGSGSGAPVQWTLTFKGVNTGGEFHSRRELETEVADGSELLTILEQLDFKELLRVKKKRRSYVRGPFTFCLDEVDQLGRFLEIEYLGGEETVVPAEAKNRINGLLEQIGLVQIRVEKKNYLQLIAEKQFLDLKNN
jgi:adenylate cyclase class IV